MLIGILTVLVVTFFCAAVFCFLITLYIQVYIVFYRRPDVSIFESSWAPTILLKPQRFTEFGQKLRYLYIAALTGFLTSALLAVLLDEIRLAAG